MDVVYGLSFTYEYVRVGNLNSIIIIIPKQTLLIAWDK